jgi:hypothetical protein
MVSFTLQPFPPEATITVIGSILGIFQKLKLVFQNLALSPYRLSHAGSTFSVIGKGTVKA